MKKLGFEKYVQNRSNVRIDGPAISINSNGTIYLNGHLTKAMHMEVLGGYVEMYYDKKNQIAGMVPLKERTEESLKFSPLSGSSKRGTVGTGGFSSHFNLSKKPVKGISVKKHGKYFIFKWPLAKKDT